MLDETAARAVVDAPDPLPPPGWYGDPLSAEHHRWWSGVAWTGYTQPVRPAPPEPSAVDVAAAPPAPEVPVIADADAADSEAFPTRRSRGRRALAPDADADADAEPTGSGEGASAAPGSPSVPALHDIPALRPLLDIPTLPPLLAQDPGFASITRQHARDVRPVQRYVPPPPAENVPGRVALGIAIAGAVCGVGVLVQPVLLPVSALLLLVAIVVAASALPRWGRRRRTAVVALVLGLVGLAIGPAALGPDRLDALRAGDLGVIGLGALAGDEHTASIGEPVVLAGGVSVTVAGIDCDAEQVVDVVGAAHVADGRYCLVRVTVANGTELPVLVDAAELLVRADGALVPASPILRDLGGRLSPTAVDPTQALDAVLVADVPVDAVVDRVELRPVWASGSTVVVPVPRSG